MTNPNKDFTYTQNLDDLCINTIRTLSMDAVQKANSGHPGAPMGMASMAYVLWTRFLKHNPADPDWFDRDRFVLSAGHASMLLYSLLHLTGYDLSIEDIKAFRQWESRTPGHPERGHTKGVETTTGPLGQGFANGVGMAIAERLLAFRFNRPDFNVIDHFTYAICSDGDLMEGVSSEAASLAGHLRLGKLVYLYDSNRITIDGSTDLAFSEDVGARFSAYGWHVIKVGDGNDLDALTDAIGQARGDARPSLIVVSTNIGYGSPKRQDTAAAHGQPLGEDEVKASKQNLGWDPEAEFFVPDQSRDKFREALESGRKTQDGWEALMNSYAAAHPESAAELDRIIRGELPAGWDENLPVFKTDEPPMATRKASGKAINAIAPRLPELVGGSADLAESNLTDIEDGGELSATQTGRNIHFGVREHAMGAALNGMAVHGGVQPFGGTFLIFSDYMKPSIRLAALMKASPTYVFTHDSVGLGEDGPTHEPIEHLAGLRAIPGLVVLRPADANETVHAWRYAVSRKQTDWAGPVALCLTRQNLPILPTTESAAATGVPKGAYVLYDPPGGGIDIILMATGSEVNVAYDASQHLASEGIGARVVSMPSWELFRRQDQTYRDEVLPPNIKARLSVEAQSTFGWERWVGDQGEAFGLDRFGASAPGGTILNELGFNAANITNRARRLLEKLKT